MNEIWLSVVGQEGRYEVSDLGRVRTVGHWVNAPQNGGRRWVRNRVLKMNLCNGYFIVSMGRGQQSAKVHQLVAAAFIGPANGREVRHGRLGKTVNTPANLSYGTHAENGADAAWDRNNEVPHGEAHCCARLTAAIVTEMRIRNRNGESYRRLAAEFGVGVVTVADAVTGKTWAHVI